MRGLLLHPADVPVLVVFEDASDRLWEDSLRAWGSLAPQIIDPVADADAEGVRLVVLSQRPSSEVLEAYPQALELTSMDSSDEALAAERLTVHVTMHLLKAHAGSKHLLHAAVLGDAESGQAVGLVAASGTGKTTAASVLGASLAYLSDETAVINIDDMSIMPYPKPLSVIETANAPKVQYDPAQRGLKVAAPGSTYTLSHLVILDRDKTGKAPLSWERLPLDDALFAIILQSSGVQQMPQGLGELARLINRVGGAIKLTYSEITETLPFFRDLLAGQLDIPPLTPDFEYLCTPEPVTDGLSSENLYQRVAGTEGLAVEDSFLLTTSGRLSRISIIGWDIWSFLETPHRADDIYAAMVELYGDIARPDFDATLRGMVAGQMIKVIRHSDAPEDAPIPDSRT